MTLIYILFGILLLFLTLLGRSIVLMRSENSRLLREVNYYQTTYLRRQGGTTWNGGLLSYELRSLDGGLTWYAAQREGEVVRIIGEANIVYPGLLDHLIGMDALVAHVKKHGPIGGTGEISSVDLGILSDAGFKVEKK